MFHTILVPLDGSARAETALLHAELLAKGLDAEVKLLRVIPMRQRRGAAPLDVVDRLGQVEAHAYIESLVAQLKERGVRAEGEVTAGPPADRVVGAVRASGTDLVILTSHGSGGCVEFPLGGTAQKVIARAGTSVLIVPEGHIPLRSNGAQYRRVLVGVDGSQRCESALSIAAELGRVAGAELVLCHVVALREDATAVPLSEEHRLLRERLAVLDRAAAETYLGDAAARLDGPDHPVRVRVEAAVDIAPAFLRLAEAEQADLIVLAAHGTSAGSGWVYGAVATHLLAEVRRPVLIVQDVTTRPTSGQTGHQQAMRNRMQQPFDRLTV
jgi:nucleotide-binding universal stress UspA family protein